MCDKNCVGICSKLPTVLNPSISRKKALVFTVQLLNNLIEDEMPRDMRFMLFESRDTICQILKELEHESYKK